MSKETQPKETKVAEKKIVAEKPVDKDLGNLKSISSTKDEKSAAIKPAPKAEIKPYNKKEIVQAFQSFTRREGYYVRWVEHLSEMDVLNLIRLLICAKKFTLREIGLDDQRFRLWNDSLTHLPLNRQT